jgi:predicted metal-dependent phosphoesterase TrpH
MSDGRDGWSMLDHVHMARSIRAEHLTSILIRQAQKATEVGEQLGSVGVQAIDRTTTLAFQLLTKISKQCSKRFDLYKLHAVCKTNIDAHRSLLCRLV